MGRVLGRVALWGKVVECEWGWRGARAYPALIYVPTGPHRNVSMPKGHLLGWRPQYVPLPEEEVAAALGEYGVPVEFVDCDSVAELADVLDSDFCRGRISSGPREDVGLDLLRREDVGAESHPARGKM